MGREFRPDRLHLGRRRRAYHRRAGQGDDMATALAVLQVEEALHALEPEDSRRHPFEYPDGIVARSWLQPVTSVKLV